jgi:hypothetical protein
MDAHDERPATPVELGRWLEQHRDEIGGGAHGIEASDGAGSVNGQAHAGSIPGHRDRPTTRRHRVTGTNRRRRQGRATPTPPSPMLILATSYALAYKVMRCAARTGVRPIVVGVPGNPGDPSNDPARFRRSRLCSYVELPVPLSDAEAIPHLRSIISENHVHRVAPGDSGATRFLAANRSQLRGLYPLPDLSTFDLLNDKWSFASLCRSLDVPHPRTWKVESAAELRSFVEHTDVELIAKPLSSESGAGVMRVDRTNYAQVTYQPILLQELIEGHDRCISLICRDGVPKVSVVYHYENGSFITHRDDRIYALASRIVGALRYDGVINFDVRETPDGELDFIEANPRFWANVDKTLVGGDVNFVAEGFAPLAPGDDVVHVPSSVVRTLPAMARGLLEGHWLSAADIRYLRFVFAESVVDVMRDGVKRQIEKLRRRRLLAGPRRQPRPAADPPMRAESTHTSTSGRPAA